MSEAREPSPSTQFRREVHRALRHLYDAGELATSPLREAFGIAGHEMPLGLRKALIDAIEALKPAPTVPGQSRDWRVYRTLHHRYVEQFTQRQVAASLSMSVRQLRREEVEGVRLLAEVLWAQYVTKDAGKPDAAREEELAWARRSFRSGLADAAAVLAEALATIAPLLEAQHVKVENAVPEGAVRLAMQPDSLRQALLNLLTTAVQSVPGGKVRIEAEPRGSEAALTVIPEGAVVATLGPEGQESLAMAEQLVGLSGGRLEVQAPPLASDPAPAEGGARAWSVQIILPAAEGAAVLVIDDNLDTLQLYQRYLAGSRFHFVGTHDPEQGLELAEHIVPRAILLDLMLPGIDGWKILQRLREHPKTHHVRVIVCSILPQADLALALGAAGFLRKPVTREELLAALERESPAGLPAGQ